RNCTRCAQHREKVVKFSLASRRTFSYKTDFSSPNTVRNSAYGPQVRMSKLRSTHLRDTRPNRRNSSVPKLQCGGHRSDYLYVTSPTTGATTGAIRDKIPGGKTLRDHHDFDRRLCGGTGQDQETDQMDGRFHRRAELADW